MRPEGQRELVACGQRSCFLPCASNETQTVAANVDSGMGVDALQSHVTGDPFSLEEWVVSEESEAPTLQYKGYEIRATPLQLSSVT